MDLISQVTLLGGVCDRKTLVRLRSGPEVDAALRQGTLIRDARGRYSLATTRSSLRTANSVGGILSHRSAAHHWGWAQKAPPALPDITFPREFYVPKELRTQLVPHWSDVPAWQVEGRVTSRVRTLVDCMRNLPLDESVPIVHSAISADDFTHTEVCAIAESTKGRGRTRILEVATAATGKVANPLEGVLHAQAMQIPGLHVEPQLPVHVRGRKRPLHPDLGDDELQLAVEAEGFEWHSNRAQITRDCRRYNALLLAGWIVVRFTWVHVMHEPAYVHDTLLGFVELARNMRMSRE